MQRLQACSQVGLELRNRYSPQELLVALNPNALQAKFGQITTAAQALNCPIRLLDIELGYSRKASILLLSAQLLKLQGFLNVKDENRLGAEELQEISDLCITDYSSFTLADITLVLNNFKRGLYGEIYNRIDPVQILSSFREYQKERAKAILQQPKEFRQLDITPEGLEEATQRVRIWCKTEDRFIKELQIWKLHVCSYCRENKINNCKQAAVTLCKQQIRSQHPTISYFSTDRFLVSTYNLKECNYDK